MKRIAIISVLFTFLFQSIAFSQVWTPTTYDVSFKIKNAGLTVTGRFTGLKTTLNFSPDKPESGSLKASVEVATIKTGIDQRDKDLQGEKYFNSDKYKTIEMASTKLYKTDNGYKGMFNVTIKGVTKKIEIPFSFTESGNEGTFTGSFPLSRKDFGVGGKTLTMSDALTVNIMIKAKK